MSNFLKIQLDNLVDLKIFLKKTRIYLQKSVPIQPKTSQNIPKNGNYRADGARAAAAAGGAAGRQAPRVRTRRVVANLGQISAKFRSFSAVSAPIFASKYSFFSIFRDLQDLHTFAPLRAQNSS